MFDIGLAVAFTAGLVSFLAPCVLPLVPGFLAYLAGSSVGESKPSRWAVFRQSVWFVLGFSSVFALLGVLLNTLLEAIAYDVQIWLGRVGGVIVIFFGLYLTGLIKIGFLEKEHRIRVKKRFSIKGLTSFLFGAAFAAGWTPCVGAALGAILGLAASRPGTAFVLLLAYSLGLGLPFLLVGVFAGSVTTFLAKHAKTIHYVNVAFGGLLIALGILIFTNNLSLIANFESVTRLLGE